MKKVLDVHTRWTRRLNENRDEALPKLGEALNGLTGKTLPAGVFEQAFSRTTFTDEPLEATFRTYAQWAFDVGFSKAPADISGLIDVSSLRELP